MRVRDVNEGAVLLLLRRNPDVMTYMKLKAKHSDGRRVVLQPSHGRVLKIVYAGRSCATVYRA